jgi:hypothetical protein
MTRLRMQPRVLSVDERRRGRQGDPPRPGPPSGGAAGAAVLIASSDDAELCDCCDRALVVRDGRIAGTLEGDEINSHALARLQLAAAA